MIPAGGKILGVVFWNKIRIGANPGLEQMLGENSNQAFTLGTWLCSNADFIPTCFTPNPAVLIANPTILGKRISVSYLFSINGQNDHFLLYLRVDTVGLKTEIFIFAVFFSKKKFYRFFSHFVCFFCMTDQYTTIGLNISQRRPVQTSTRGGKSTNQINLILKAISEPAFKNGLGNHFKF